jgi:NAD(P)-dependent dehydrogenase (short-subunit alcohol dehydrogenase family)
MPIVVITGASQGIGAATAHAFSKLSHSKLILLARNEVALREVAASCRANGAEADYFVCDVTHEESVKQTALTVLEKWGTPDILVNNAGVFSQTAFLNSDVAQLRSQLEANVVSAYLVTQAFINSMLGRGAGDIFFLCSIASLKAYGDTVLYTTAKHALLGFARGLREELKMRGIRVTAIMPGATLTPSWDGVNVPAEKFIPAADIANIIVNTHLLDKRTDVEEIVIRPRFGDLVLD